MESASQIPIEVEVRFRFSDRPEAFSQLPFLRPKMRPTGQWETTVYGLALFESGELLRISKVLLDDNTRWFLAWKGPDVGEFANIRQELGEEVTSGATASQILRRLGCSRETVKTRELDTELCSLGYEPFMSFSGVDHVGVFEPSGLDVKLMECAELKWPLLVEVEKIAHTQREATLCEDVLRKFCNTFNLLDRMVKEEPPTLLYSRITLDNKHG